MSLDFDGPPPDRTAPRTLPLERVMRARVSSWANVEDFLTCPSDALIGAFGQLADAANYPRFGSSLDATGWHEVDATSARGLLLHLLSWSSAYGHRIRSPEAASEAADRFFGDLPQPQRFLVSSEKFACVDAHGELLTTTGGWGSGQRLVDDHVFETWVVVVTPTTVAAFVQLDDD